MGVLGFKVPADCRGLSGVDEAICLHEVAIGLAAVGDEGGAIQSCQDILGTTVSTRQGQANLCYADVAKLREDVRICNRIQLSRASAILTGAEVSRETCVQSVQARLRARDYQCGLLFALPVAGLLGLAIFKKKE